MSPMDAAGMFGSPLELLQSNVGGFGEAVFYKLISDYLDNEIITAFNRVFTRSLTWVSGIAFILMSIWVWWQGWRIMTGQSQESMARFFATSAQRVFIIGIAFGAALGSTNVFFWLGNELPKSVNYIVTGDFQAPSTGIDRNLAYMQLSLSSIDVLQTGGDQAVQDAKTRSMWMAAVGTAGPAVVGGAMLLLNKIAMGLFVGLGPLFVLALVFDYTKPLFQKWLYYGLGTIFALVMLNLMIGIATEMIARVSAALWMGSFVTTLVTGGEGAEGITSRAMQQGGLGVILTLLIVTTPPMAAAFFNGVMGQFQAYSAFQGGIGTGARGPGTPPVAGQQTANRDNGGQSVRNDSPPNAGGVVDPRIALGLQQRSPGGTVPSPPGGGLQAWRETPIHNQTAAAQPSAQPTMMPTIPVSPSLPPPRGPGPQG